MENEVELKPCPFCGNKYVDITSNGMESYSVICRSCGAEGPGAPLKYVIDVWNRRIESCEK